MTEPRRLPSFERPPVHEVALSVQFKPCTKLKTVHLGLLWGNLKAEYPSAEDLPPFADFEEINSPRVELIHLPQLRRVRMSRKDSTVSIQIQDTRFITNWVRSNTNVSYPRFRAIFAEFAEAFAKIEMFFREQEIGELEPTYYELTYVNELGEVNDNLMPRLENLLSFCKWNHIERNFLGDPTVVNFAWQFNMPNDEGKLILNVNPAKRSDGTEVVLFILKCIVPANKTASPLPVWFEAAHETIVRSFTELTTSAAHLEWGRIE